MPRGTIKNQSMIPDDGGPTRLFNTGIVYLIEPEGDSNLNPPEEMRFVSTLEVSTDDKVFFHHVIVGNKHVGMVYAKMLTGDDQDQEKHQRHKML